jgi:peptide/nickel transport system substrate-binding protein/oligopeptide transport system substrate-binding protein
LTGRRTLPAPPRLRSASIIPPLRRHFLALGTAIGLVACSPEAPSRTLEYYFTYDPRSLDPAFSTDVPTGEVDALLFDNLTQFDVDGRLQPGLAKSWEVDPTGSRYTFHLRTNATFHDGRPVRASDVEASWIRALSPKSLGGRPWPLYPILGARAFNKGEAAGVTGLVVSDDSTLVVTLEEPLNIFPKLVAMPSTGIVPTPTGDDFDQSPVGSGPWRFVSWSHDDYIVLAKNPAYWGSIPLADSMRIRIIPEPLTQAAEYERGGLSIVEIPFGETRRWEERHGSELKRRPTIRDLYIAINTTRGPLSDVRVRQALNLAVDVPTLLQTVMAGRGLRAHGVIPPGITGYDSTRAPFPYDPDSARALLAAAGHAGGLSIKLWRSQRPEYARIAQAVQQDLAAVGIQVEIVQRDASSARAAVRKGEADLFLTDWYADYPDPENFTYPLFNSKNAGTGGNYAFLKDPVIDSLTVRVRTTVDEAEKARLARETDARIFALAPWIFLWHPVDLYALNPRVEGWNIPAIFNGQRWQQAHIIGVDAKP